MDSSSSQVKVVPIYGDALEAGHAFQSFNPMLGGTV